MRYEIIIGLLLFAGGFATADHFSHQRDKDSNQRLDLARTLSDKSSADLNRDIEVCKKIYAARVKINTALGLPEDDSDPLNLGVDSGKLDYEKHMDKLYGPLPSK
jgi:hypothetical protein